MGMPTRNTRIIRAYWLGELATVHRLLAEEPSRIENRPMFQCLNNALLGNLDRAAELFCQATNASTDIAFVDLGFMRAKARCRSHWSRNWKAIRAFRACSNRKALTKFGATG
jgi:hypothetical protein